MSIISKLKIKKVISLLAVVVLIFSMAAASAYAEADTYKITFIYPYATGKADRVVIEVPKGEPIGDLLPTPPCDQDLPDGTETGCVAGKGQWYGVISGTSVIIDKNTTPTGPMAVTTKAHTAQKDENGRDKWEHDAEHHWKICSIDGCGKIIMSEAEHTPDIDNVCAVCKYDMKHTCSSATLGAQVQVVQPTCVNPGRMSYYQCNECGKYYISNTTLGDPYEYEELTITAEAAEIANPESNVHKFSNATSEAVYVSDGSNGHYQACEYGCGTHKTQLEEHQWNEGVCVLCKFSNDNAHVCSEGSVTLIEEKAATCTQEGVSAHYECTYPDCGKLYAVSGNGSGADFTKAVTKGDLIIASAGHQYGDWKTDAEHVGNHYKVCEKCQDKVVEAHQYGEWKLDPDVADKANHYHQCSVCSNKESVEHPAASQEVVKIQDATCTQGAIVETRCKDCNSVIATDEFDDALGHTPGDAPEYKDKGDGAHFYTCVTCSEEVVEAHEPDTSNPDASEDDQLCVKCGAVIAYHQCANHLTHVTAKAASCTEDGNIDYYQCACGKFYKDAMASIEVTEEETVVKASGHKEEIVPGKAATCTQTGLSQGKICSVCKAVLTPQTEIGKLPHDFSDKWSSDVDGHYHICENCGQKDEVIEHTSSGPATEDTPETCIVCGQVLKPALDHKCVNYLTHVTAKAATCTEDGNVDYYQCACGKYYADAMATVELKEEEIVIKAAGHKEEIVPGKAATCMEAGLSDGKICTVCKTELAPQTVIDKLPHDFSKDWSSDADGHYHACLNECGTKDEIVKHTSSGPATEETAEVCTVCGYVINPALNHDCAEYLTHVPAKEADCTHDGNVEYYQCKCGKLFADAAAATELTQEEAVIKAAGHKEEVVSGQAATCTETGMSDGKRCSVCGLELEPQTVIEKLPHHYVPYWSFNENGHYHICINECGAVDEVVKHTSSGPATEEKEEVCTICGYVIAPALGHKEHQLKFVEAVAATETEDGHTAYYECSECGKLFEDASGAVEITDRESVIIKATGPVIQPPTDAPIQTAPPVQTTEPPVQTTTPAPTETPAQTTEPVSTDMPAQTEEPAQTTDVPATEEPAQTTELPEQTEKAVQSDTPANKINPVTTNAPVTSPRTGDEAQLGWWIIALCISGIGIVSVIGKKKTVKSR